ncbi:MAG: NUDIX hydrolase [Halomonas sp.]|jgi:8-oxo-dGTP diphosphatase|uniref:NUDIX domain-containing protein n=1 Tax=Billgrantia tianxiuensis TaxID=2497861 RepID=A0A6I6SLI2_9GAMM|nr:MULTISPECIES: NUDIX hydrolase [Halomonas]MCE8031754.1 NUDIX hydrolase [Halomonas sp. MCCC 1A11057]MDX5434688.1 NUDIX hydrolase [Halomonas sp.]QHC50131.1 NUDIX domain-containing protein [Halomonas tianxiuensis]
MSIHEEEEVKPIPAVAAALVHQDRVLTIRRRNPPNAGMLALPGGRLEPGETLFEAARRELYEETGLTAGPERVLTAIDQLQHDEKGRLLSHYVIVVVSCRWTGGNAMAGDDASEMLWLDERQVREEPDLCASARRVALLLLEPQAIR